MQVEVEEQDIDEDGNVIRTTAIENKIEESTQAIIRDSSRNRLQRLGALYSDSTDISSPIHRTEGKFHEEIDETRSAAKPKNRFGKLAALASSINSWEDDSSHPDYKHSSVSSSSKELPGPPKPKRLSTPKKNQEKKTATTPIKDQEKKTGTTPKKYAAPTPPKEISKPVVSPRRNAAPTPPSPPKATEAKSNQLRWDPKVMNALESQGFQRRQSNTSKLVYDYKDERERPLPVVDKITEEPEKPKSNLQKIPSVVPGSEIEKKNGVNKSSTSSVFTSKIDLPRGIVSGRAAIFENQSVLSNASSTKTQQKDPAEMSLKERMALFEKNKGQALIPKAPIAISVGSKQITGEKPKEHQSVRPIIELPRPREDPPKPPQVKQINKDESVTGSKASGTGIRTTVAALLSGGTTISESQISDNVKKQRQQEMDLLMNRFKASEKQPSVLPMSPPQPPPMPPSLLSSEHVEATCIINNNKRRSGKLFAMVYIILLNLKYNYYFQEITTMIMYQLVFVPYLMKLNVYV